MNAGEMTKMLKGMLENGIGETTDEAIESIVSLASALPNESFDKLNEVLEKIIELEELK